MKSTDWSDEPLLRGYRSSATALLNTILRALVDERKEPIWTTTLVRALEVCGVKERNARQAISRVAEKGDLRPEKVGAKTRWHVTAKGHALFASAQTRAMDFCAVQADWDGQWWILICDLSDLPRETRPVLRARLQFRGCGFINGSTVVSTHVDREDVVLGVLREFGLADGAVALGARTRGLPTDHELLRGIWNPEDLTRKYAVFIDSFEAKSAERDDETFAAYIELEHKWVQMVALDPELPRSLLPNPWIGERAKALVDDKRKTWRKKAQRWLAQVEAAGN